MRAFSHLGWEVVPVIILYSLLALSTNVSTEAYAFHGNATEDALLESPGATSPSTGLACEVGTSNEVILNIEKTSGARATFQCITNSTIVFSFEEENTIWGWSIIELLKTRAGFSVDEIVPSGLGGVGNPTRFYVIMSGPS
jgi:hypothetical protein